MSAVIAGRRAPSLAAFPPAVLAAVVLLAGCAGSSAPPEPVVAPTGKVYERGTPPEDTRHSQTAALYLRRDRTERALELAREGTESTPGNAVHHYLAGIAQARLGHYAAADSLLDRAEEIYPAYELEIEPVRESAWARAYNAGMDAYAAGELERAIEAWRGATTIYDLRPDAHRALAGALVREGRRSEAIEVYRDALEGLERWPATRVLEESELREREEARSAMERRLARLLVAEGRWAEAVPLLRSRLESDPADVELRSDLALALARLGRTEEADRLYGSILSEGNLEADRLASLGNTFFRMDAHDRAVEAFGRLVELRPRSRDAWYNYANALFAAEEWATLASRGERLLELDPLGENSILIVARAHLESGDEEAARELVRRADAAPIHVNRLRMQRSGPRTAVLGRAVGNGAEPGTPVRLRFVLHGPDGRLGARAVTVEAPEPGESEFFEVTIDGRAEGYRYELAERDEAAASRPQR